MAAALTDAAATSTARRANAIATVRTPAGVHANQVIAVDTRHRSLAKGSQKMAKQPRYRVVTNKNQWAVKKGDATVATAATKDRAVDIGKQIAKADRGQLVIEKKNGRIQTEYTYGHDPKRRPG